MVIKETVQSNNTIRNLHEVSIGKIYANMAVHTISNKFEAIVKAVDNSNLHGVINKQSEATQGYTRLLTRPS